MPFDGSSSSSSSAASGLTEATGTGVGDTDASSTTESLSSDSASSGTTPDSSTSAAESTTTTGVDASPPAILGYNFSPSSLLVSGPISVEVLTEGADGVRLTFGYQLIELVSEGDGIFTGEVQIYTGADNGEHAVTITPWSGEGDDEEEGEAEETTYVVALPPPGSELFWEAGDLIGPGIGVAVALLPSGDLVELGTRYDDGFEPRCYLRRRDPGGTWGPGDYVQVLPGVRCEATDLAIDADGGIHVLAQRGAEGEAVWWLGSIASWGAAPATRGLGSQDEEANALAENDGTIVICGAMPSGLGDLDVMLRTYRPQQTGILKKLDYKPPGVIPSHTVDENAYDCVFRAPDDLVVIGDAFGQHVDDGPKLNRRFSLRYDPVANNNAEEPFIVHAPELGDPAQSFARGVTIGDFDDAIIVGYSCHENCVKDEYEGRLWVELSQGNLLDEISLGFFGIESYAPHAVAWSPAHYVVVASGGPDDDFLLGAYKPFKDEPSWQFSKKTAGKLQIARDVLIGSAGEVYGVGIGAGYYPAIAYVGG